MAGRPTRGRSSYEARFKGPPPPRYRRGHSKRSSSRRDAPYRFRPVHTNPIYSNHPRDRPLEEEPYGHHQGGSTPNSMDYVGASALEVSLRLLTELASNIAVPHPQPPSYHSTLDDHYDAHNDPHWMDLGFDSTHNDPLPNSRQVGGDSTYGHVPLVHDEVRSSPCLFGDRYGSEIGHSSYHDDSRQKSDEILHNPSLPSNSGHADTFMRDYIPPSGFDIGRPDDRGEPRRSGLECVRDGKTMSIGHPYDGDHYRNIETRPHGSSGPHDYAFTEPQCVDPRIHVETAGSRSCNDNDFKQPQGLSDYRSFIPLHSSDESNFYPHCHSPGLNQSLGKRCHANDDRYRSDSDLFLPPTKKLFGVRDMSRHSRSLDDHSQIHMLSKDLAVNSHSKYSVVERLGPSLHQGGINRMFSPTERGPSPHRDVGKVYRPRPMNIKARLGPKKCDMPELPDLREKLNERRSSISPQSSTPLLPFPAVASPSIPAPSPSIRGVKGSADKETKLLPTNTVESPRSVPPVVGHSPTTRDIKIPVQQRHSVTRDTSMAVQQKHPVNRDSSMAVHQKHPVNKDTDTSMAVQQKHPVTRDSSMVVQQKHPVNKDTSMAVQQKQPVTRDTSMAVQQMQSVTRDTSMAVQQKQPVSRDTSMAVQQKQPVTRDTSKAVQQKQPITRDTSVAVQQKQPVTRDSSMAVQQKQPVTRDTSKAVQQKQPVTRDTSVAVQQKQPVTRGTSKAVQQKQPVTRDTSMSVQQKQPITRDTSMAVQEKQPVTRDTSMAVQQKQPVTRNTSMAVQQKQPVTRNTSMAVQQRQPVTKARTRASGKVGGDTERNQSPLTVRKQNLPGKQTVQLEHGIPPMTLSGFPPMTPPGFPPTQALTSAQLLLINGIKKYCSLVGASNSFQFNMATIGCGFKPVGGHAGAASKPVESIVGAASKPVGDDVSDSSKPHAGDHVGAASKPVESIVGAASKPVGDDVSDSSKPHAGNHVGVGSKSHVGSSTKPPMRGHCSSQLSADSPITQPLQVVRSTRDSHECSESEGSECGLVIDEDPQTSLHDPSVQSDTQNRDVTISTCERENAKKKESTDSLRNTCEKKTTASTKKIAKKLYDSVLKHDLVVKLTSCNGVNLLLKLYNSVRLLRSCFMGHTIWHHSLSLRIRSLFKSYSISSAVPPVTLKSLYIKELSHLQKICGNKVSKWREHIQRFNLLASTIPKSVEDLSSSGSEDGQRTKGKRKNKRVERKKKKGKKDEVSSDEVVVLSVKNIPDVIVISSDDDDGDDSSKTLSLFIKSEPTSDQLLPDEGGQALGGSSGEREQVIGNVSDEKSEQNELGNGDHSDKGLPLSQTSAHHQLGPATTVVENISPHSPVSGLVSTKQDAISNDERPLIPSLMGSSLAQVNGWITAHYANTEQVNSTGQVVGQATSSCHDASLDPGDISCGECSMSVCSILSENGDEFKESSDPTLLNREKLSLDVSTTAECNEVEKELHDKSDDIVAKGKEGEVCTRRNRSVSLSSGELTPTPPSSPKIPSQNIDFSKHKLQHSNLHQSDSKSSSKQVSEQSTTSILNEKSTRSHPLPKRKHWAPPHPRSRPLRQSSIYHSHRGRPYRRSKSRSREFHRPSRRSRSPILASRGKSRARRRPHSISPRPSKEKDTKYEDKTKDVRQPSNVEEDLELLQLKKEVILSIVQRPEASKEPKNTSIVASEVESGQEITSPCVNPPLKSADDQQSTPPPLTPKVTTDPLPIVMTDASLPKEDTSDSTEDNRNLSSKNLKVPPTSDKPLLSCSQAGVGSSSPVMSPAHSIATALTTVTSSTSETKISSLVKSKPVSSVKHSVSVKVCPGNESTWKIQPFQITSSDADSDGEGGGMDASKSGTKSGCFSEISRFLFEARKEATEVSIGRERDPLPSTTLTSSSEVIDPPSALPLDQQKEYMLLKRKLALHEKKKLQELRSPGCFSQQSPSGSRGGSIQSQSGTKKVSSQIQSSIISQSQPDARESSIRNFTCIGKSPSPKNAPSPKPVAPEEGQRPANETGNMEQKNRITACRQKMAEYTQRLDSCKSMQEEEQLRITVLTNQMTECVSEIEKHEHDMEKVQEQLISLHNKMETATTAVRLCEQRMVQLQQSVRLAKEKTAQFGLEVKEYEQVISEQSKELKELESQAVKNTVPEFESVSDCDDPSNIRKSTDKHLKVVKHQELYEAISDSETAPTSQQVPKILLTKPSLEIEPISDAEDNTAGVEDTTNNIPIEMEPVSDTEPEPSSSKTQLEQSSPVIDRQAGFPPLEIEPLTDADSEVDSVCLVSSRQVFKEHNYCKSLNIGGEHCSEAQQSVARTSGSYSDHSVPATVHTSDSIEGIQSFTEPQVSVISESFDVYEEDDPSLVCRRTLPFQKKGSESSVLKQHTPGDKSIHRKASQPRRLALPFKSSSSGIENILNLAMKKALSPALYQFHVSKQKMNSTLKSHNVSRSHSLVHSSQGSVLPLLNSVMNVLMQQSFTSITASASAPSTDDDSRSCIQNEQPEYTNLDSYFHPCNENMFTLSREDPPALVVPRCKYSFDLPLGVETTSIAPVAFRAVQESLTLAAKDVSTEREEEEMAHCDADNLKGVETPSGGKVVKAKAVNTTLVHKSSTKKTALSDGSKEEGKVGVSSLKKAAEKKSEDLIKDRSAKMTDVLKKHMDQIEELKSKIAAKSSGNKSPSYHLTDNVSLKNPTTKPQAAAKSLQLLNSLPTESLNTSKEHRVLTNVSMKQGGASRKQQPSPNTLKPATTADKSATTIDKLATKADDKSATTTDKPVTKADKPADKHTTTAAATLTGKSTTITDRQETTPKKLQLALPDNLKRIIITEKLSHARKQSVTPLLEGSKNESVGTPKIQSAKSKESGSKIIKPPVVSQVGGKKQPISTSKSQSLKIDPTETCARTSGFTPSKVFPPPSGAQSSNSAGNSGPTGITQLVSKVLSLKNGSELMERISLMEAVSSETSQDLSSLSLLSSNCMMMKNSSPPVHLSESVLNEVLCSQDPASSSVTTTSGYKPYSSPLSMFTSYRLNPAFRSVHKLPLSSMTYSNKMNPKKVMCRFELSGICIDPKCTAQHIRDVAMTREELIRDLVSYAPSLAGCTKQEVVSVSSDQSKLAEVISAKISLYSSKFVEKYGDSVSDEELYMLAVDEINKKRGKNRPGKEFVCFEDRTWLTPAPSDVFKRLPVKTTQNRTDLVCRTAYTLPRTQTLRRYFSVEEPSVIKDTTGSPSSNILSSARKFITNKALDKAMAVLEEGLKGHPKDEEMWICYIQLKMQMCTTQLQPVYGFFHEAVTSSGSYTVVLETIRLARCYESKLTAIRDGLTLLKSPSHSEAGPITSRRCLELFMNAILLDLQTGRLSAALSRFDQSRLTDNMESDPFTGLLNILSRQERIVLSLSHLSVVYCKQLPSSLFSADSHHVLPVHITDFQPFVIPFNTNNTLPVPDYRKMLRLFKVYLNFLQDQGPPIDTAKAVERSLPLYHNLFLFEAAHGSHQKTINMLSKLTAVCPHMQSFWITLARIRELDGMDSNEVMVKATSACPRKAELYYLAARLELSRAKIPLKLSSEAKNSNTSSSDAGMSEGDSTSHHDRLEKAVEWLVRCVKNFYSSPPGELSTAQMLTLYRKLLNQMIGYNETVPPLADGVDPKALGDQHAPLWMCYCLLVEMTVPPSSSSLFHDSAADAYESALHSILSQEGRKAIWREYIHYTRARVTRTGQGFKRLLDCVQRCLVDVECEYVPLHGTESNGEDSTCEDYTFHNEMITVLTECLPPSNLKLSLLRKFVGLFPRDTALIKEMVECALQQNPTCSDVAQTTLAEYLAFNPHSPVLWNVAIEVELQLKHTREARWLFSKALQSLPLHAKLWKNLLVFETKEAMATGAPSVSYPALPITSTVQAITGLVEKASQFGIDLVSVLREVVTCTTSCRAPKTN